MAKKESEDKKDKAEDGAAGDDGAKAAKKKKMLFIIIGAVAVLGIAGGAFLFLSKGGSKEAQHSTESGGEHGEGAGEHGKTAAEDNTAGGKAEGGEHGAAGKAEGGEHGKAEAKGGEHGAAGKAEGGEHGKAETKGDKKSSGEHGGGDKDAKKDAKADHKEDAANETGFGKTLTMKAFHLNLGNPIENHYIRLEVSLEYKGGSTQEEELKSRDPQLRDAIITVTSKKTREFLLSPDGKDRLRLEILNQINSLMSKPIENVYITDFIIE